MAFPHAGTLRKPAEGKKSLHGRGGFFVARTGNAAEGIARFAQQFSGRNEVVVAQIGELANALDLRQRGGVVEADFSEKIAHESSVFLLHMGVVVFVIRARTRQRTARERFFYASKNERVYQLGAVVRVDFLKAKTGAGGATF